MRLHQSKPDRTTVEAALVRARKELAERELAKREFLEFVKYMVPYEYHTGWFHVELAETLDAFLQAVEEKRSPRLIVQVPPRHGKSELVSRHFPAYVLGNHPEWEVVCATYGQVLADKFGRHVRGVLNDHRTTDLFPQLTIDKRSNSVDFVATEQGGFFKATGVGGMLTGMGANVLIIDDPVKDREEADSETVQEKVWDWYNSTARTRLYDGAGVILVMTRWNERDLAGRLLEHAEENEEAEQWHVISYPALAEEDEPYRKRGEALCPAIMRTESLKKLKMSINPRDWNALYQQNPVPAEGNFFKLEYIRFYPTHSFPKNTYNYITCDLAISEKETADYSTVMPFGVDSSGDVYFHQDYVRKRMDAFEIVDTIIDKAIKFNAMAIFIEKTQVQMTIMPLLKQRMAERRRFFTIHTPSPQKDKQARAATLQGRMQNSKVFWPDCQRWKIEGVPEFLAFPAGRHDDLVDAAAHGVRELEKLVTPAPPPGVPDEEDASPPEWSAEWIRRRQPQSRSKFRKHVPPTLRGLPR